MISIFKKIIKMVIWPFRATYRVLVRFVKLVRNVFMLIFLAYIAFSTYEYAVLSHNYDRGGACNEERNSFFRRVISKAEFFECLDATKVKNNKYNNYLILLADVDNPDFTGTGHGYIAWMRTSRRAESIVMHNFQVLHWGPRGEAVHPGWYARIKAFVPKAVRSELDTFVLRAFRPGGYYAINQDLKIDTEVELTPTFPTNEQIKRFIREPETILAISIDDNLFDDLITLKNDIGNVGYKLLLHDCTELVEEAAYKAGLYVPPRILSPFPSQMVRRIYSLNFRNESRS